MGAWENFWAGIGIGAELAELQKDFIGVDDFLRSDEGKAAVKELVHDLKANGCSKATLDVAKDLARITGTIRSTLTP